MLTNQRRVSVDQSERRGSRFNQSEPSSQNAMRGTDGIKGTVPSFLPFPSVTGTNSTSICERTRCGAQRKHVNISRSHGHECHFAEVQSGGIIRWRHLAGKFNQSVPSSQHSTIRPPPPPPSPPPPTTRKTTKTTTKRRRRQQRRRYVNRNNYFVFDNNSNNNENSSYRCRPMQRRSPSRSYKRAAAVRSL